MISTALYLLLVLFALAQLASSAELLESTAEVATCPRGSRCRCLPFDHCWPGSDKWHSLNDTVDGRLIANVPLGSPCHDPSYDQEACDELSRTWTLPQTQYVPSLTSRFRMMRAIVKLYLGLQCTEA